MPVDDFDKFKKSLPSKGFSNAKSVLDDCDRPACDDTMSALNAALKHAKGYSPSSSKPEQPTTQRCPPTKGALGSSSWDLLHSMVAWYPEKPAPTDETMMKQFFSSFARFYPCTWCAEDFQKNLEMKPVE